MFEATCAPLLMLQGRHVRRVTPQLPEARGERAGLAGTGTGTGTGTGVTTTLTGDVNGDGKVDETDISLLKQALSGNSPIKKAAMDINADGVVNTRDLIDLIRGIRSQVRASRLQDTATTAR